MNANTENTGKPELLENYSDVEIAVLREELLADFTFFCRFFHKVLTGDKFIFSPLHTVLCETLQRTTIPKDQGGISRLVISIFPGAGKTQLGAIYLMAYGIALNPRSKFIHASFGGTLASLNSQTVRDVVTSEEFIYLFETSLRKDRDAKAFWSTIDGGGVYATSMMGVVTGFRAGYSIDPKLPKHFRGCIIIDDPQKPSEIYSKNYRMKTAENFNKTFASRLAQEDVPIIIIQQRLHSEDFSGHLLKGGSGEDWYHLNLPAMIPENYVYPVELNPRGIEIKHTLEVGPSLDWKLNEDECARLASSDPYVWSAQYLQNPLSESNSIIKSHWIHDNSYLLAELPYLDIQYSFITVDTALKTGETNDYTVAQHWAMSNTKGLFLINQLRGKWDPEELNGVIATFYNECIAETKLHFRVRGMYIEDKAAGPGLIAALKKNLGFNIVAVPRSIGKVQRMYDVVTHIATGKVHLPRDAYYFNSLLSEILEFGAESQGEHDDQVDCLIDGVEFAFVTNMITTMSYGAWA